MKTQKTFLSLCTGCGGMDLGLERAGWKCIGQVEIMPFAQKILRKRWPQVPKHTDVSTLLRSASLVRTFRKQTRKEKVLPANEAEFSLSVCASFNFCVRAGYSLKTSRACLPSIRDGIWPSSFTRWPKAAMGGHTEFWTVKTSDFRSGESGCSLLDVLEESPPRRYYFSRKAIAGILQRSMRFNRRAEIYLLRKNPKRLIPVPVENLEMKKEGLYLKHLTHPDAALPTSGVRITLRKLTAAERERLQGFPTGWTAADSA